MMTSLLLQSLDSCTRFQ